MTLTSAEQMAVAVLQGKMDVAIGLALMLVDEYRNGTKEILPLRKILTADRERLRFVLYVNRDFSETDFEHASCREAIENWLREGVPLALGGIDRMEVFELPE